MCVVQQWRGSSSNFVMTQCIKLLHIAKGKQPETTSGMYKLIYRHWYQFYMLAFVLIYFKMQYEDIH